MTRTLILSAATLLLAACATAPKPETTPAPQPAAPPAQAATGTASTGAFDPVGSYTFSANLEGQSIGGTMSITRGTDGTLGGEVTSNQGVVRLRSVTLEGRKMTAYGTLESGPEVGFVLNFEGEGFSGTFNVQGTGGTISGTRRKE